MILRHSKCMINLQSVIIMRFLTLKNLLSLSLLHYTFFKSNLDGKFLKPLWNIRFSSRWSLKFFFVNYFLSYGNIRTSLKFSLLSVVDHSKLEVLSIKLVLILQESIIWKYWNCKKKLRKDAVCVCVRHRQLLGQQFSLICLRKKVFKIL